jgi:hypothetical protein
MDETPVLRVVRGTPTAEEVAALVGVLVLHARSAAAEQPAPGVSRWRASALPRAGLRPGPGAWRASAHPA